MRECIETTLERMLVTAVVFLKSHGVVFLEAWLGRVFKKLGTYIPGTAITIKKIIIKKNERGLSAQCFGSSGPDFMPFILCQIDSMPFFSREHHFFFIFYRLPFVLP